MRAIATLAVDEGPSHDPAKIETSVSDGKLSGTKAFVQSFGAEVRNAMSGLVRPGDHADFASFLKAAQGAWDGVWARTHKS